MPRAQVRFSEAPELASIRSRAAGLFLSGKYREAAAIYQGGYEQSAKRGARISALRFLNSTGACWLACLEYGPAMKAFLDARELADQAQDREMAGVVSLNLSSMYLQMGDVAGAMEESRRAAEALRAVPDSRYRAQSLVQNAKLQVWDSGLGAALPQFFAAIREADAQGDIALKSLVMNQLGCEYLKAGRLEEAERAMTEGFRLRVLFRSRDLSQSYRALGLLRLAQGDLSSAGVLIGRAMETGGPGRAGVPGWRDYHARGQLRFRQQRIREALSDYRRAMRLARAWRAGIIPVESIRSTSDEGLGQLFASFVRAAAELHFATGEAAPAREAFAAAEEMRAASLRRTLDRGTRSLPASSGRLLDELRLARAGHLRAGSAAALERIRRIHTRLAALEARAALDAPAGSEPATEQGLAETISARLGPSDALISFHLGEPHSYAWAATREGLEMYRLPGAGRLEASARAFSAAVRDDSTDAAALGAHLYADLFGQCSRRVATKRRWLLSMQDSLFGTPFPALVEELKGGRPVFLAERHSVALVPGAASLAGARRTPAQSGGFLGIADPIYNVADERWHSRPDPGGSIELPRVVASAREVEACAREWGAAVLLEGAGARRDAIARELDRGPSVIHFATHVIRSNESPARQIIPLSLLPQGIPDLLGPEDIARWRLPRPATVVISGCGSGTPEAGPAAYTSAASPIAPDRPAELGLAGLARAWLTAGGRDVAVTLWPTTDDDGGLFRSFYRHLRANGGAEPAAALQLAQIEMLNSRTWRSHAKHWAAYVVVSRG